MEKKLTELEATGSKSIYVLRLLSYDGSTITSRVTIHGREAIRLYDSQMAAHGVAQMLFRENLDFAKCLPEGPLGDALFGAAVLEWHEALENKSGSTVHISRAGLAYHEDYDEEMEDYYDELAAGLEAFGGTRSDEFYGEEWEKEQKEHGDTTKGDYWEALFKKEYADWKERNGL